MQPSLAGVCADSLLGISDRSADAHPGSEKARAVGFRQESNGYVAFVIRCNPTLP